MLNFLLAAFDNLTPMNWDVLKPALNFLWQGMLAIFVVIGLIIVSVKVVSYAIAKADEAKKRKEEQANETNETNS
jgi:Na+-transporting methylmalonyl-CoA/oxaloacetate decarboxylase gamma subunit